MVKVKICGITNLEDALVSVFAGANALGFVFYKKSPRYIHWRQAQNIARLLPAKILRVGVFVDEKPARVKKIARLCALDILQFHGQESTAYCRKFKGYKIIKAFRIAKLADLDQIYRYKTFAYLFDSAAGNRLGGSGKKFNWKILAQSARIEPVMFISGGLTPANVRQAVKLLKPDWVDVSSGLESRPGKKDHRKIQRFIQALH